MSDTTYSVESIAKFFITVANEKDSGMPLGNTKLQKLLYYAQGFHLAITDEPLFKNDFKAWDYGPVIPEVYKQFNAKGRQGFEEAPDVEPLSSLEGFLQNVWDSFGKYSASTLSQRTHDEPPWQEAPRYGTISKKSMQVFFKTILPEPKS